MKISLIMPTIGRYDEVKIFLDSLVNQTYKNFELIIVDQNEDNSIEELKNKYNYDIKYIKSDTLGLSFNRNKGLLIATGDIVAFPDDDCEYETNTLERAVNFLYNKPKTIYSCRTVEKGKDYGTGNMLLQDSDITMFNVENTVKSITFFVNLKGSDLYLFDVKLGVGSIFKSGEETDYVLNLLHNGFEGKYFANHLIYHPAKKGNYEDLQRAYDYALGYGALCKKEIIVRKNLIYTFNYLKKLFRSLGGMIVTKNRKYHLTVLKGRIKGFIDYE